MKKTMLAAAMLLISALAFAGCADGAAEEFVPHTYSADAQEIQSIEVDVRDRPIYVSAADGEEVRVDYAESPKERYDIAEESGALRISLAEGTKSWTDLISIKAPEADREIRITVPKDALSSLRVSTTNAPVRVFPIQVKEDVQLTSNGGDVEVEELGAGTSISMNVKNGNICGTLAGSRSEYRVSTEIKKGKTNLTDSTAQGDILLSLEANNGDITLGFTDDANGSN